MPTAFILINSELSHDEEIIGKIKEILDVDSDLKYQIQGVYGIYDIVLKVSSVNALGIVVNIALVVSPPGYTL